MKDRSMLALVARLRRYVGRRAQEVYRRIRAPFRAVRALADARTGIGGAHDLRSAGAIGWGAGRGVGGEPRLHKPNDAVAHPDERRTAMVQAWGEEGLFQDKAWGVVRDHAPRDGSARQLPQDG